MRKKLFLALFTLIVFLTACGNREVLVQPIPDSTEQYDYVETSVPVIDAIIDTEAERAYIQKIQREYNQFAGYYEALVSRTSTLSRQNRPEVAASAQGNLGLLIEDMEKFILRVNTIELPAEYRKAMLDSLSAFLHSLRDEQQRLAVKEETEGVPSSELYQKAHEKNKELNGIYRNLLSN